MNYGDLILNDVKVVEKFAHSGGGGIYSVSGSSLSMTESIIANNQVIGHGGGLSVSGDVPLILTNVVIDQNEAGSSNMGGGIYVNYSPIPASMTLDKVMISGNVGKGGGVYGWRLGYDDHE